VFTTLEAAICKAIEIAEVKRNAALVKFKLQDTIINFSSNKEYTRFNRCVYKTSCI